MAESLSDNDARVNLVHDVLENLILGMFYRRGMMPDQGSLDDVWRILDAASLLGYRYVPSSEIPRCSTPTNRREP